MRKLLSCFLSVGLMLGSVGVVCNAEKPDSQQEATVNPEGTAADSATSESQSSGSLLNRCNNWFQSLITRFSPLGVNLSRQLQDALAADTSLRAMIEGSRTALPVVPTPVVPPVQAARPEVQEPVGPATDITRQDELPEQTIERLDWRRDVRNVMLPFAPTYSDLARNWPITHAMGWDYEHDIHLLAAVPEERFGETVPLSERLQFDAFRQVWPDALLLGFLFGEDWDTPRRI